MKSTLKQTVLSPVFWLTIILFSTFFPWLLQQLELSARNRNLLLGIGSVSFGVVLGFFLARSESATLADEKEVTWEEEKAFLEGLIANAKADLESNYTEEEKAAFSRIKERLKRRD